MPRQGGKSTSGKSLQVITVNKTDVSRYQFRLSDCTTQKAVKTQHQDQKTGALKVVQLDNEESPDGLPPVHTDRHIYPNETAARKAAKVRLAAFNRSTAGVRLEMAGRHDLFAECSVNAQGFKVGLDGEYLVESVEQVFTASGWTTTVECNGGKKGKAKASGKKKKDRSVTAACSIHPTCLSSPSTPHCRPAGTGSERGLTPWLTRCCRPMTRCSS